MLTHSFLRTALLAALLVAALTGVVFFASTRVRAANRAVFAGGGCDPTAEPFAEAQIDGNPRINLRVAQTQQERELGLGFVQEMPPDDGMVFVYSSPSFESYWMLHTLIPLSIAWLDRDGMILDIQDMDTLNNPDDQTEAARHVHTSAVLPYWYALEVNEGWFVQHGVGVGQQILFCLGGA